MILLENLSESEIKEVSRHVSDSFYDYEYCSDDLGLKKNITNPDDMFVYINPKISIRELTKDKFFKAENIKCNVKKGMIANGIYAHMVNQQMAAQNWKI